MQRSRSPRATKKTSTPRSTSATKVARVQSSSLRSLSVTTSAVTRGSSSPVAAHSGAFGRSMSASRASSQKSSSVVSKRSFAASNDGENGEPTIGGGEGRENSLPQRRQGQRPGFRQPFFRVEHVDNSAINSLPKFGRAVLSQPFPPLRQKIVNPDLTFGDFTHKDISTGWHVIASYPKDFTFVCPSELNELADRIDEFKKLNTKVWGLSCDSENVHHAWMSTPRKQGGIEGLTFPLIADVNRVVTSSIGALLPENFGTRATLIYGNGKLRHASFNEPPVGRSVDEILRLIAAFQHFDEHGEVCPAKWKKAGDPTMIPTKEGSRQYFEQEQ